MFESHINAKCTGGPTEFLQRYMEIFSNSPLHPRLLSSLCSPVHLFHSRICFIRSLLRIHPANCFFKEPLDVRNPEVVNPSPEKPAQFCNLLFHILTMVPRCKSSYLILKLLDSCRVYPDMSRINYKTQIRYPCLRLVVWVLVGFTFRFGSFSKMCVFICNPQCFGWPCAMFQDTPAARQTCRAHIKPGKEQKTDLCRVNFAN